MGRAEIRELVEQIRMRPDAVRRDQPHRHQGEAEIEDVVGEVPAVGVAGRV
jgi:hypothetical protein